ncbi:MAG TPA: hypothetical protein VG458_09405 [Solirubrobacterales bacterium]|nr:hypothetical protein [Solirubrobacterales bacterium]
MSHVRYRAEPGWQEKLEAQPEMDKGMNERADVVAGIAKSIAPVGPTHRYKHLLRATGNKVRAFTSHWHFVEFGSVNQRPLGVLRRAVIQAGLKFKPHPKP